MATLWKFTRDNDDNIIDTEFYMLDDIVIPTRNTDAEGMYLRALLVMGIVLGIVVMVLIAA